MSKTTLLVISGIIAISAVTTGVILWKNNSPKLSAPTQENAVSNSTAAQTETSQQQNQHPLKHTISLAQIGIHDTGTENGNGAIFYKEMLELDTRKPDDVRRAVELLALIVKKKDFSIYPELQPYPTIEDFPKQAVFPFSTANFKTQDIVTYANSLSDESAKQQIFSNLVILGRKIVSENDYINALPFLIGLFAEQQGVEQLIKLDTSSRRQYDNTMKAYLEENNAIRKRLSSLLMESTRLPFKIGAYTSEEETFFQQLTISEPVIQNESLVTLMFVFVRGNEPESTLAKNVLSSYASGSNEVTAGLAKQILDPVNKQKIINILQESQN